jgi:hypothetical protein
MRRSWAHAATSAEVLRSLSITTLATRAYVLGVGLCATLLLGFPDGFVLPASSSANPILDLPLRWDAEWYVGLAKGGYRWDGSPGVLENIAFFPAYPLMLRVAAWATGAADSVVRWYWTGVILSTALLGAALWFLARLGDLLVGPSTGHRAALLCAVYPWSIYFGLPYTESLFLLACCAATYRFLTKRHAEAFVWALIAGLTRPNGILLSLLFGMLWIKDAYDWRIALRTEGTASAVPGSEHREDTSVEVPKWERRNSGARALLQSAIPICGPILGIAIYSTYVHGVTGDPLTWLSAQEAWGRPSMNPLWVLGKFLEELTASPIAMARAHPYAMLNGLTGLAVLAFVVPVGRRLGWAFAAFVLLGVLMPIAGGGLASLGRYTAILFPLFIYVAHAVPGPAFVSLVSLSLLAQGLTSALFFTWRPVY